jgi:hypothetical protein
MHGVRYAKGTTAYEVKLGCVQRPWPPAKHMGILHITASLSAVHSVPPLRGPALRTSPRMGTAMPKCRPRPSSRTHYVCANMASL